MQNFLSKEDIAYNNYNFWWFYVSLIPGFDDEKEYNLDDAIEAVIDKNRYVPNQAEWFSEFCPKAGVEKDGYYENSKAIEELLKDDFRVYIEFNRWQITFYLNDIYIGNIGGHFETRFLTWDELLFFDKYDYMFLLFLPMVGIAQHQRLVAEMMISEKLSQLTMFNGQEKYIAKCIVNGLLVENGFYETEGIGIMSAENHSVRNFEKYPRYKDNVTILNQALKRFCSEKE